jgi:hypothetical protein
MKNGLILLLIVFVKISFAQVLDTTKLHTHNGQNVQKESKFMTGFHVAPSGVKWLADKAFFSDFQLKMGYVFGVSSQYILTNRISLRAEINYENKGCRTSSSIIDFNGNAVGTLVENHNLAYLSVPITAKIKLNKSLPIYANIGGYINYVLSYRVTDNTYNQNSTTIFSGINAFNRFDYGIVTGVGLMHMINTHSTFFIELRNNLGLTGIIDNSGKKNAFDNKVFNESIALLLGFNFKNISNH